MDKVSNRPPLWVLLLIDAWDVWLGYFHPHWAWLDKLSPSWGNPFCAAYCFGWSGRRGMYGWFFRRYGSLPGDWFADHPNTPRKARGWSAPVKRGDSR